MMHHVYKRHFIKNVIFRLDFPIPIPSLEDCQRPVEFQRKVLTSFPIPEEKKSYRQSAQFSPEGVKSESIESMLYTFHNPDHTCKIGLDSTFMFIEHTVYQGFEEFIRLVDLAVKSLYEVWPETAVNRLGLRYLNEITLVGGKDVLDWSELINSRLLGSIDLFGGPESISRYLVQTEMRNPDYFARILTGIPNLDYPGIIRQRHFIIDIDIYTSESVDSKEISQKVDLFHEAIIKYFESSITQNLRNYMDSDDHVK